MSLALFIGGPPYPLDTAQIGGLPSVSVDIPPLAVFLALYATSAIISIILFEHQRRRHLSCTVPVILFLFSGERVLTCVLRIFWAFKLTNVRVAVASQVSLQAGVLLLFLLNLILAERFWLDRKLRARTHVRLRFALVTLSTLTISALIMEIASIIVSVYTLDQKTISTCRNVQRAGATYFLILATTPLAMLALAFLTSPASSTKRQGTFSGELFRLSVTIVSSVLCIMNAGFKTGVVWTPPRSLFDPAWYHSRACLYLFGFTMEVCVLILLYATRADLKFPQTTDQGNMNIEHDITALDNSEITAPHSN
ncbi:hypothetical protein VM1G_11657 [Cytospora mali]|uniref:Uncharacterized protein n=1 Tax=Cytospora mali TaxID=578113 RepID=A0A194W2W3_CYTMA|nr:hypothetical protein VM1G_11657 [Valsa mali]